MAEPIRHLVKHQHSSPGKRPYIQQDTWKETHTESFTLTLDPPECWRHKKLLF